MNYFGLDFSRINWLWNPVK